MRCLKFSCPLLLLALLCVDAGAVDLFGGMKGSLKSVGKQVEASHNTNLAIIKASEPAGPKAVDAAAKLANDTDNAFTTLEKEGLLDTKFAAYKLVWADIKPELQRAPANPLIVQRVDQFGMQFVKATYSADTTCTIVVAASRGEGAIVQYAKAHDADLGRPYRQLAGMTTLIQELERAEYRFKAFRNGKETGTSGVVACTGKGPMKVVVAE